MENISLSRNAGVECLRTSKSFHDWEPAPRWRPLPWLANPDNSAISPHAAEKGRMQAPVTLIKSVEKGRGGREKRY